MAQSTPIALNSRLARAAVIRPATIDDLSSIRYLHATAMRLLGGTHLTSEDIEAFRRRVYSPAYGDAVLASRLCTAWIGSELVGSGGWSVSAGTGSEAVLGYVFVRPPFAGSGLGRRLVVMLETDARACGRRGFVADVTLNAAAFFAKLGYQAPAEVLPVIGGTLDLPVLRMVKSDRFSVA